MKVKAFIDRSVFEQGAYENTIRFDAVFAVEKGIKIDFKTFQNIEFDVPIVNELGRYSVNELKEELLRREKDFPKSFAFCCRCKEPIFTNPVFHCCNENVLARTFPE